MTTELESKAMEMFNIPGEETPETVSFDTAPTETPTTAEVPKEAPEAPEDVKVVEAQASEDLSSKELNKRFLRLTQRERAIEERERQEKAQRDEERKQIAEFQQAKAMLERDPDQFLKVFGTDYNKLSQRWLDKQHADPVVSSEIQRLRDEQERLKQEYQTFVQAQQQQVYESVITNYKADLQKAMQDDQYELARQHGDEAIDLVLGIQRRRAEQGLADASIPEVLQFVEDHYLEKAKKLVSAKKLQSLLTDQKSPTQQGASSRSKGSTISTDHTSKLPDAKKVLTPKEREQLALSMFDIKQ